MNLPNKLTLIRICLVPVICVCMYFEQGSMWFSAVLFAIAAITDFADGKIARARNLITDFGKFMDPIADKLLVICPLIILISLGRFPAWMCAVIVARELAVSGFRLVAALANRVIAADKLGFDPAVMASPFITTIVDVLSLMIYFRIAAVLLHL